MKSRKKVTINSYDKTAEEYHRVVSEFKALPEIFEFESLVKKNGRILDLGCGPGQHSKYFSDIGYDVVGIDLSQKMIELARKTAPNASFEVMDISRLSFNAEIFDGIWASASLLHIPRAEIRTVLKKLFQLLKIGGILYMSLKIGQGEEILKDYRYQGVEKFYIFYSQIEIESLLIEKNFIILSNKIREKRVDYDTNPWVHVFCKKE